MCSATLVLSSTTTSITTITITTTIIIPLSIITVTIAISEVILLVLHSHHHLHNHTILQSIHVHTPQPFSPSVSQSTSQTVMHIIHCPRNMKQEKHLEIQDISNLSNGSPLQAHRKHFGTALPHPHLIRTPSTSHPSHRTVASGAEDASFPSIQILSPPPLSYIHTYPRPFLICRTPANATAAAGAGRHPSRLPTARTASRLLTAKDDKMRRKVGNK